MSQQTKTYVPGRSIDEARLLSGMEEILKVGSNENVLGPSPRAMAAVEAALHDIHLYPGQEESLLMQKLAAWIGGGLTEDHFVTGNGSCDVLRMITHTFVGQGGKTVIPAATFGMYQFLVSMYGREAVTVPLKDYTIDLQAVLEAIDEDVRLVFICNPNNPTGTTVTHEQVGAFLAQVPPHLVVVFDEAYMEFADDPDFPRMVEYVQAGHKIVVTRTFSKLHGLASLRIGYGFGHPDLIAAIRRNKLVFNSGRLAYIGAAAAVDDEEHIVATLDMVRQGREYFYRAFDELGLRYVPTQSNFIFLHHLPVDAATICEKAIKRGIILRRTDFFGLPDDIRITIARQHENERVVQALREILQDG